MKLNRTLLSSRVASKLHRRVAIGPDGAAAAERPDPLGDLAALPVALQRRMGNAYRAHDALARVKRSATQSVYEAQFIDAVTLGLRDRTKLGRIPPTAPTDRIIARYLADVATIDLELGALHRFLAVITDTSTHMNASVDHREHDAAAGVLAVEHARGRYAGTWCNQMFPEGAFQANVATAPLVARPPAEVHEACRRDVEDRCRGLADYVVDCLLAGIEHGLFGLVAWPGPDACCYARNERRLWLQGHWSGSRYECWHVVKEVHLMQAMTLRGVPGWLDTPPHIGRVVKAIPRSLVPFVDTVIGTMIREREHSWRVGEVQYQPHQRVAPQPAPVFDPALVIGPVVLTGYERPAHAKPRWWLPLRAGWQALDLWRVRRK